MAFVKYSTVPLEVIADDEQNPTWVKKAQEENDEERERLRTMMKDALLDEEK
jgi:hypothetical protein